MRLYTAQVHQRDKDRKNRANELDKFNKYGTLFTFHHNGSSSSSIKKENGEEK